MKTTCGVLVIDPDLRILACHPTRHSALQWDIPKGCVDFGEKYVETVLREFEEETSIDLLTLKGVLTDFSDVHGTFKYHKRDKELYGFVFELHDTIDITKFKCNSNVTGHPYLPDFPEIDSFAWITFEERFVLHPTQQSMLEIYWRRIDIDNCNKRNDAFYNHLNEVKSNIYG